MVGDRGSQRGWYGPWLGILLVTSGTGCGFIGVDLVVAPEADDGASALDGPSADGGPPRDAGGSPNDDSGLPPDAAPPQCTGGDSGCGVQLGTVWRIRSLPYASGAAASAVLSDGLHYLGGSDHYFARTRYTQHYVYDATSNSWSDPLAPVPDDDTWGARAHVYQDTLYLLGGYPGGDRLRAYSPATGRWTTLAPPPVPFQWGFASAVVGDSLYAFGGVPGDATSAEGYRYDFATDTWSAVAPIPQNRGRGALSSAAVGDRIYVLNGNRDDGDTLLQIYDTATDRWSLGATLRGHTFEAAAAVAVGRRVFFLGGAEDQDQVDSSPLPATLSAQVNVYDTDADRWSTAAPLLEPRMWSTAQLFAGQLYVLGGLDARSAQLATYEVLAE